MANCFCYFAKRAPTEPCDDRLALSIELLGSNPGLLHVTAKKIRYLFGCELEWMKLSNGRCPTTLYVLAYAVACRWESETQEVEGIMHMIQCNSKKGPCSHALVDARVGNRKDLTYDREVRGVPRKWSDLLPVMQSTIQDAVAHAQDGKAILGDPQRFATPCHPRGPSFPTSPS